MTEAILQLNREKTIFWSLLGTLLLCVGFYMYFINITVHNIVARQNIENQSSILNLTIGSEEFQYITMRNKVTLQLAYSLGFKNTEVTTFISPDISNQVSLLTR